MLGQRKHATLGWLALTGLSACDLPGHRGPRVHSHDRDGGYASAQRLPVRILALVGMGCTLPSAWSGWIILLVQVGQHGLIPANRRRIRCLTLFWHFLDVVWIAVFSPRPPDRIPVMSAPRHSSPPLLRQVGIRLPLVSPESASRVPAARTATSASSWPSSSPLIPFGLVMTDAFEDTATTALIVVSLGVVQIIVHMVYFLQMNRRAEGSWVLPASSSPCPGRHPASGDAGAWPC